MSRLGIVASSILGFGIGGVVGGFAGRELEKQIGSRAALSQDEATLGGGVIGAAIGSALFAAFAATPDAPTKTGVGDLPRVSHPRFP